MQVIRSLWDTGHRTVGFEGRHYRLPGTRPGPHAPSLIPLWIGSFGPRLLRLTGRLADGWAPTNRYADPTRIGRIAITSTMGPPRPVVTYVAAAGLNACLAAMYRS